MTTGQQPSRALLAEDESLVSWYSVLRPPKRIQRKRTKGWRMPDGAVYVGRPTVWGNEFRPGMLDMNDRPLGVQRSVDLYGIALRRFLDDGPPEASGYLGPLVGRDLVCWCRLDQPCHADVLLELANR